MELQSSILTKKLKDYDVSKMVMKESPEKQLSNLKKDLLTNNTSMTPIPMQTPVNYKKELEKKKKMFMTEMVDEDLENNRSKKAKPTAKFIQQRNTRYDNHLTDSSQVPELISNIRKMQGMNLMKSNSMKKFKHLDTNELLQDCDIEMTKFENLTIKEIETPSRAESENKADQTASVIIQNKLNEFMTQNTEGSQSKHFQRPTEDTTLGSLMDIPEEVARKRFLTLNKKSGMKLGNYQIIQNQYRTNANSEKNENVGNSQYLRTVVHNNDAFTQNWETRIEEEGVEMGEIMIDDRGTLRETGQTDFNDKLAELKKEQEMTDLMLDKAKKNPNYDSPMRKEELSEDMNNSIQSELFNEKTPRKEEKSKSPELLVITNDAPVKKRKFRLGKSRKKNPKKKKRDEERVLEKGKKTEISESIKRKTEIDKQNKNFEKQDQNEEVKNLEISMPKEIPKAIEMNFGFESNIFFNKSNCKKHGRKKEKNVRKATKK